MTADDRVFVRLQKHLDQQAVGFPATTSGAEIRILRHIFTLHEAKIATCLTYRPEPVETIYLRADHLVGSPEELAGVLDAVQKKGGVESRKRPVLQPSNTQTADFICSCCGCCCGMLDIHQKLPRPLDFWASNFFARVDADACSGCGACEKRCQVHAVRVSSESRLAAVDLNRCIGCGLCVPVCPENAIRLEKKTTEVKPPESREALYDIIMTNKKGRMGKAKLTGKLLADMVRTGRTDLIK